MPVIKVMLMLIIVLASFTSSDKNPELFVALYVSILYKSPLSLLIEVTVNKLTIA